MKPRSLVFCFLLLMLSACAMTPGLSDVSMDILLAEGETVKETAVRAVGQLLLDINGDAEKDAIGIVEESYLTVFENGENGGFVIPFLKATVKGKEHYLQLCNFRGYTGLNAAFDVAVDGRNFVFVSLDMGGNHFLTAALYAVTFTDRLEFLPLPAGSSEPEVLYPNALSHLPAEATFDPEAQSVVLSAAGLSSPTNWPLNTQQLAAVEAFWQSRQEAPNFYAIQAMISPFLEIERSENGDSILLTNRLLAVHSPLYIAVGTLVSELSWENGAFAVTNLTVFPYEEQAHSVPSKQAPCAELTRTGGISCKQNGAFGPFAVFQEGSFRFRVLTVDGSTLFL